MYIMKTREPRQEPCGTPVVISSKSSELICDEGFSKLCRKVIRNIGQR